MKKMVEYTFDYELRPMVLIDVLCVTGEKISLASLIDSGADKSISFKAIGKVLGIKFSGKPTDKITGIDRVVKGWKRPISIEFCNQRFSIDVVWLNKRFNAEEDILMILGRAPLFDKFDIEFKNNSKIVFRK